MIIERAWVANDEQAAEYAGLDRITLWRTIRRSNKAAGISGGGDAGKGA